MYIEDEHIIMVTCRCTTILMSDAYASLLVTHYPPIILRVILDDGMSFHAYRDWLSRL